MKKPMLPLCLLGSLIALPALADDTITPAVPNATATPASSTTADTSTASYHFVAVQNAMPDGDAIYEVDFVDSTNHPSTVLQIVSGTKALDEMARAKIIADRLQKYSESDKSFWSGLKPNTENKELVVSFNTPDNIIVTADARSAKITEMSPDQYAAYLLDGIKRALTGKLRAEPFDWQLTTPDQKLARANVYRQQAEKSFADKDMDRAEKLFLQAKKISPDYDVPYIALANMYLQQGRTADAKAVVKEATDRSLKIQDTVDQIMPSQSQRFAALIK